MRFLCPRASLLVPSFALLAAIAGCGDGDTPKVLGGVGDACTGDIDCRIGLTCRAGMCDPSGTSLNGDACQLTAECAAGLYCSPARLCEAAGDGVDGDPCESTADCSMGLVCASVRGDLRCTRGGGGDLGDSCTDDLDCLAGLSCGSVAGRYVCVSGSSELDGGMPPSDASVDGGALDAGERVDAGPGPYLIGGNVTGLTSGSVELMLNGTEALTLSASGPFTFTTLLDRGANYGVDVTEQPTTGLRCTPSGGRGIVNGPVAYIRLDCSPGTPVSTWEPVTPPPAAVTRKFNDVWVADADRVYVVGPVNAVLSWDGAAFAMESLPTTGRTFFSVGGTDREHIWVGGASSLMLYYDGFSWTQSTVGPAGGPTQTWQGMWVPEGRSASRWPDPVVTPWVPETIAWAVSSGGRIARFDGTAWSLQTAELGDYHAIAGFDDQNVFIARNVGRVLSGESGAFTRAWDMGGATSDYLGVTVFQSAFDNPDTDMVDESAYDAVAVGASGTGDGIIVRCHVDNRPDFLGTTPVTTWTVESPPAGTVGLEDVWAASPDAIWAVGAGGTVIKYNGSSWVRQTTGTTEDLHAVDGIDAANVWIVGDRGVILRGR